MRKKGKKTGEVHVIIIRNIPDDMYDKLWMLRRYYKFRSWKDLLEFILKQWEEELEGEWL